VDRLERACAISPFETGGTSAAMTIALAIVYHHDGEDVS
jgi:hypothetical protein